MNELETQIIKIISSIEDIKYYDCELVKENGILIYRVYITKKNGVNINDCNEVNELLSPLLDVYEPTNRRYFFEVSSPGIERNLKKIEHYENSISESVKIVLLNGNIATGTVNKVEKDIITIDNTKFNFKDIKKASTILLME